jgi:hypothetical protein
MATTIPNGSKYMQAVTYTGTGATQTITVGFQPDFVWVKSRSAATDHKLTDSVRGATKALISDTTGAETTDTNGVTAFTSTGFTLGSDSVYNTNGATYVAWCWQAGQGSTGSNTNGSITSTVSVNASAGFSVATWTAPASGSFTIGHSLGVAPKFIITKVRNAADNWLIWHTSLGANGYLLFTTGASASNATIYNGTPTSTLINYGSYLPANGSTYVTYSWAEIAGFSKFGSYTGNGSTDGTFIYLGFRPKFVLIKCSSTTENWSIIDSSRNTYNLSDSDLFPSLSNAETTNMGLDLLSNGFKLRTTNTVNGNASGATYIYAAFAENPFKNSLAR